MSDESLREQALYSLLVPLERMRLIVPRDCVAEVVGWQAAPGGAVADPSRPWLAGELEWDGRRVPVLSFERLCGIDLDLPRQRARVVVMRCLGKTFPPGYFGVITAGFPQIVRVSADVLVPEEEAQWPEGAPVLCQLRMVGQTPVIPDLEQVEQRLAASA